MTFRFSYAIIGINESMYLLIWSIANGIMLTSMQGSVTMIYEVTNSKNISALFGKWEETLIWSCLQGIMGKLYTDDWDNSTATMAILGDFTFFAGKPNMELISYKPDWCHQDFHQRRISPKRARLCMRRKTDIGMLTAKSISQLGRAKQIFRFLSRETRVPLQSYLHSD